MDQICSERVFPVKNGKSEHHHLILHIRISLGTKFQLKLTVLNFFDQICPKRVFPFMVITHYIKLFRTEVVRHNGILMTLFLLVAETTRNLFVSQWSLPILDICWAVRKCLLFPLINLLPVFRKKRMCFY